MRLDAAGLPAHARLAALALLAAAACGDGASDRRPAPDGRDVVERLRDAPAIASVTEITGAQLATMAIPPDHRFFAITFDQPVDHGGGGARFPQHASLLFRSVEAPTVLYTTGYDLPRTAARTGGSPLPAPVTAELTALLGANQLLVEHRFFADSAPATLDWSALTIEQSANDFHRIVEAVRPILDGPWVSTGASKGGMTSIYHRRFHPDDVDATVAYVAPNSLAVDDDRYVAFLDGEDDGGDDVWLRNDALACRDRVHALQRAALLRRDELEPIMVARAGADGDGFTLLGATEAEAVRRALEFGVLEAPFALWQYRHDGFCDALLGIPDPLTGEGAIPAEDLYGFLDLTIGDLHVWIGDAALLRYAPYYYQSATELGGPAYPQGHLDGLVSTPDVPAIYPPLDVAKTFDGTRMAAVQEWVTTAGERLMFVYGENDPWTAAAFEENPARDQVRYTVTGRGGNHGAKLGRLGLGAQAEAVATLRGWLGLPPATGAPGALRVVPADDEDLLRPRRRL